LTANRKLRGDAIPPRDDWPTPPVRTEAGDLFTDMVIATFRLNGRLMDVAQHLAAEGGLTAAWWQVIGGILDEPRTVADIARRMGMTRQGVQRVADLVVARGLAEYRPNPAHRRAMLLACTEAGYWAIRRIALAQRPWADSVAASIGADEFRHTLAMMRRLIDKLEADASLTHSSDSSHEQTQEPPSLPIPVPLPRTVPDATAG
jgi:DNA-binding MarR family transcriptional regulator